MTMRIPPKAMKTLWHWSLTTLLLFFSTSTSYEIVLPSTPFSYIRSLHDHPSCAKMEYTLTPATPADAPRLTDIYFSAFNSDFSRRLFPPADDTRAFKIAGLEHDAEETQADGKKTSLIKLVGKADGQEPVIAGFALWNFHEGYADEEAEKSSSSGDAEFPASSDRELCKRFFGRVVQEKKNAIGDQPHYYLSLLAIDPAFGRQGLGAKLLKWGLDRADEERVITFISSSPQGRGLYEKHNCCALNNYEVVPGYRETSMVRPVGGMTRG
ncbi:hypothetical protein BJX70DRAFT_202284 [Aspergillus crustosus]